MQQYQLNKKGRPVISYKESVMNKPLTLPIFKAWLLHYSDPESQESLFVGTYKFMNYAEQRRLNSSVKIQVTDHMKKNKNFRERTYTEKLIDQAQNDVDLDSLDSYDIVKDIFVLKNLLQKEEDDEKKAFDEKKERENAEIAMFFNYDVADEYGEEGEFEDMYQMN